MKEKALMDTNGNLLKINCVVAVDPGQSNGGIAVYIPSNPSACRVKVVKMPKNIADLKEFFAYYAENYKPLVFIEKLSVRPDDVKVQDEKAAMGKLYRIQKMMANFEHIKAIIEAAGIPYIMTHPLSWQTKLKLRLKNVQEEKSARKRRYEEAAQSLYPAIKVTLWNADALLLLHFGRIMLANDMNWIMSNLPQREISKLF